MQKLMMLKNANGCPDGIHSVHYKAGECYEFTPILAKCFLDMKVATIPQEKAQAEKAEIESPKNKALKSAPKNKSVGE